MYKSFLKTLLSYLVYYKNCINLLVDDYQFGYITKLKKKNCDHNVFVVYIENLLQRLDCSKHVNSYPLPIMLGKAPKDPR
jgi:hypothetical protein